MRIRNTDEASFGYTEDSDDVSSLIEQAIHVLPSAGPYSSLEEATARQHIHVYIMSGVCILVKSR